MFSYNQFQIINMKHSAYNSRRINMKFLTYNSLNFNKWLSNSTIEFLESCLKIGEKVYLYYFYLPFYHFKKNDLLFYFSSIYLFKKIKIKK